jgi:hypothetical protein
LIEHRKGHINMAKRKLKNCKKQKEMKPLKHINAQKNEVLHLSFDTIEDITPNIMDKILEKFKGYKKMRVTTKDRKYNQSFDKF